jgi:hypothetical protein
MNKGDKFTHKGIEYTVNEVKSGGSIVSGIGNVVVQETDIEGSVVTKTHKKPITIQVADIQE